jgi:hypothetical protein
MSDGEEFVDELGRLRSRRPPAGSFGYLLEVRQKEVAELRPGLTEDEFSAALGYVNTYLDYYGVNQIVALVDEIREARARLSYLSDAEFADLRKLVPGSGQPSTLADELVRGIGALRPPPLAPGRSGRPRLSEDDCGRRVRDAIRRVEAAGVDRASHDQIAFDLGMDPRNLYRWSGKFPRVAALLRSRGGP